jgi:SAM-dependent methyltransferase
MDPDFVQVLACPQCGSTLHPHSEDQLDCTGCSLTYPVEARVPMLLISAASARSAQFTDPNFERLVSEALGAPFGGWDLSWLAERCTTTTDDGPPLIEFYDRRAGKLLREAASVLDLGTGGGEHLARLGPLPPVAVATEAFAPNVSVAAERLAPSGVRIVQADPNTHRGDGPQPGNRWPERRLPLADNRFDLVLASWSAFSPVEVARVLRPGGRLLTIQNGVEWRGETLADALGGTRPDWTIPGHGWNVGETLRASGLRILRWREQPTSTTYDDIGAVVYMLLHVPWLIVDFDVSRFRDQLYALHQRIQHDGALTTCGYAYVIEAEKS